MDSYRRVAYSPNASASQTAVIKIGEGDWEISQLSVVMGGKIPALNGIMVGDGYVAFQTLEPDGTTVKDSYYLLVVRCTQWTPTVMGSPKRIHGPGRIASTLNHYQATEHTLTATYRRVRE